MAFELFVALRYLLARRKQAFISVISLISVLGVGLGVASLIVVLAVMTGFSTELRDKILGVNAHLIVMSYEGGVADYNKLTQKTAQTPGVAAATPFIYSEVMVSSSMGVKGLVLRGVDPATAGQVLDIDANMVSGKLTDLDREGAPGVVVGKELATRLGLGVGSRVNLLSPAGKQTAAGYAPKVAPFKVVGVFGTGMYEYDSSLAYVTMEAAADLLGYETVQATGVEARLEDVYAARKVGQALEAELGRPYYVRDWMEMNANLFAALQLEKTAMFVILTLIVLVGSFSIVTTLVMLVMEKTKDIAILMSMGARREQIRRIFMLQGTIIGAVGALLGYGLGIPACLLLREYQFITLPEDVYSMDHLPVRMESLDMAIIGVAALVLCFLATLYPASQAARLEPVEALRYE